MAASKPQLPADKLIAIACEANIKAQVDDTGERTGPPTFEMIAYNGGELRVAGWYYPVVVSIPGMRASNRTPILYQHDDQAVLGQSTEVRKSSRVELSGILTGENETAQDVITHAKNGFVWSASVGVYPLQLTEVKPGATVQANGKTFTGPIYLFTKSELREVSIVSIGADNKAETRIAASVKEGDAPMDFEKWVRAKGFEPDDLTDAQEKYLRAQHKAEQEAQAEDPPAGDPQNANGDTPPAQASGTPGTPAGQPAGDPVADSNARIAANMERIAKIETICGNNRELCATAIKENWTTDRAELEVLRATRDQGPTAPAILTGAGSNVSPALVLEAAACQAAGLQTIEQEYDDRTLQAAHTAFRGRLGLQRLFVECARAAGWHHMYFDDNPRECIQAAYSAAAIDGILSNIANKFLLEAFNFVEQVWRLIASVRNVRDFKTVTSYRLSATGKWEKVPATGELQHGKLGQESYTNKADTYGQVLSISRQDIINDDLGALQQLTSVLGGDAGRTLNHVFWTEFLDNASLFSSGNGNLLTGASSALGLASLALAVQKFFEMTDPKGFPVAIDPKILLVPPALSDTANSLYQSDNIRNTTASTKYPTTNTMKGMYKPAMSRYLGNSSYSGSSSTRWYLLAAAAELAVMEVAFLNGNQAPIIESTAPAANTLGISMQAYHDFGASKQEKRAGVAADGA